MSELAGRRMANLRDRFVALHDKGDYDGMEDLCAELLELLDSAYGLNNNEPTGVVQFDDSINAIAHRLTMLEDWVYGKPPPYPPYSPPRGTA